MRRLLAARRGDIAGAEALFGTVAATRRELYGPSFSLAVDLLQHGRMLNQLGQPAEALKAIDEARSMAAEHFGPKGSLPLLIDLSRADALIGLDRIAEAQATLAAVEPRMREYGKDSIENGSLLLVRAQIAFKQGDAVAAVATLNEAEKIFRSMGPAGAGYLQNVEALKRQKP